MASTSAWADHEKDLQREFGYSLLGYITVKV